MKKIYLIIIGVILFIPKIVSASGIDNIKMDIYVDKNGTAHVTEVWDVNIKNGTEGYKPYYNLGESKISNFKVSMDDIPFTYVNNWKVSASFEEKKYKNGINYIDDGIELCFGISKYGSNTYKLIYDISNFVVNTKDNYQMIYWTLFPYDYSESPNRVYIKIYSDFKYDDTLDVWGYGKYGAPTYVYDGYIEMDSKTKVKSDEYMTVLVKFPSNTFNANITIDKTFDEYYNMAEEGAVHYSSNSSFTKDILPFIMSIAIPILTFLIPILALIGRPKYGTYKLDFGKTTNKVKNAPYFRDLPYRKEELSRFYWIAAQYNLIVKNTDYLGAVLLKWLKLGNITIEKRDKNNKSKKEDTIIAFNTCANLNEEELTLYQMMFEASKDGYLEKKEFETWCKKHYSKILKWFDKVIDNETEKLIKEGLLVKEGNKKKCTVNPSMMEEAKLLAGLKKFLNDFSNIKDRSAIEVNLWEEYLMCAMIFGIAKKVIKEFKGLYPDVIYEEVYDNVNFIYFISYSGMNSATTARANSYSSGGGGFSSGSGGGGSFGGGGGGGGFR